MVEEHAKIAVIEDCDLHPVYSWISYQSHMEVAPVLGLPATDFYSKTSFGNLMQNLKYVFQEKMCYM